MRLNGVLASVAGAALFVAACGGGGGAASKTVQLATLNASGVSGTATLSDAGNNKTKVDVSVTGGSGAYADMPAHVHNGTCATLDPKPKYPLNDVKDGKSSTTIDVPLADLTKAPFAVNLHKSAAEAAIYSACGDIK